MCPLESEDENSSWRPFPPMYSSLLHVITSEQFVVQVKITSCPGHAYFPSSKVDVKICEETRFNKIPPGMT